MNSTKCLLSCLLAFSVLCSPYESATDTPVSGTRCGFTLVSFSGKAVDIQGKGLAGDAAVSAVPAASF